MESNDQNEEAKILSVDIVDSSKENTLMYSVETFERSFGDYRDGFKPIHRRILFTLEKLQAYSFTKVAKLVGAVLEFHPHGDSSVYGALVRLAQPWVMNYPLISGKGNFGTQDGDGAAAGRYIEAKLSDFAREVITSELNNVVVDYEDNFDYKSIVPKYLPTKIPMLLINGISGIGVGFRTDIPPHNLIDIANRCIWYIKNKNISNEDICEDLYPDFPTGGEILNGDELVEFYKHGTPCTISVRGKSRFDVDTNTIILYEFPYGIDVDEISDKVAKEAKNGNMILGGIESIIDNNHNSESEKDTAHISTKTFEYSCKKDANMVEILNEICRVSDFKTSISMSFMTTNNGYPHYVTVKDIIADWYKIRFDTKRRRHTRNIAASQEKLHLYEGILFIYDKKDEVIDYIKKSKKSDKETLIDSMHKKFGITKTQARGIYDMPLGTLNDFGREDLEMKIKNIKDKIMQDDYVLTHIDEVIIQELEDLKKKYGRPRRTNVLRNFQLSASERPVITKGSFIYSHTQLGLYDTNGCRDSKGILTGLRPWKGAGKGIREIIGGCQLEGSPIGFAVCYNDGTIQAVESNVFKVLNVWYDTKCDEKVITRIITASCPYYSENDELICLMDDYKIKRLSVKDISKRATGCGGIINKISRSDPKSESIDCIFVADRGEKGPVYSVIPIDDIPLLGRSASGVKSPFENDGKDSVYMTPVEIGDGDDENRLFVSTFDKDGQNYMHSIPINAFKITGRTNKPKILGLPKDQVVTSISNGKIVNKEQVLCMIGKSSSSTLSVSNFKKTFSEKKLFLTVIESQLL